MNGPFLTLHLCHGPERPERPEGAHGLEDGDVAGAEDGGREVDDGHRHDHKVQQAPRVSEVGEEALYWLGAATFDIHIGWGGVGGGVYQSGIFSPGCQSSGVTGSAQITTMAPSRKG